MLHHSLKVWGDVYDKYPAKNERRFLSGLSSSSNWQATWGWGGGVAKKHYLIKSEKCPLCSVCSLALVCGAAQFRPKDIMSIENWFKPLNKFRFYLILFLRLSLYRSTLKFNLHLKKQLERGGRTNTIILHSRILNFHDFEIWYAPCYHQCEPPSSLSHQGSGQQLPEKENSRIWPWENMYHPGDSPIRAGIGALPVEPGALVHLKTPGNRRKASPGFPMRFYFLAVEGLRYYTPSALPPTPPPTHREILKKGQVCPYAFDGVWFFPGSHVDLLLGPTAHI